MRPQQDKCQTHHRAIRIVQHDDARHFQKARRVWCSEVRALSRGWSLKKILPMHARLRARWGSLTSRIAAVSSGHRLYRASRQTHGCRARDLTHWRNSYACNASDRTAEKRGRGVLSLTAQPHENLEPETLEGLQLLRVDFRKRTRCAVECVGVAPTHLWTWGRTRSMHTLNYRQPQQMVQSDLLHCTGSYTSNHNQTHESFLNPCLLLREDVRRTYAVGQENSKCGGRSTGTIDHTNNSTTQQKFQLMTRRKRIL